MLIGIISDTHDNLHNIQKACKIFSEKKVEYVLHCGDITSASTVNFFNGQKMKFISGNADYSIEKIKETIVKNGGEILGNIGKIELDEKKIAMYHGTKPDILDELIQSGKFDFIFTGHTHVGEDKKIGKTRVINPGAHKDGENTIVVLDLKKNYANFINL